MKRRRLAWLLLASGVSLAVAPALRADVTPAPSSSHHPSRERLRQRLEQLRERAAALPPGAAGSTNPPLGASAAPLGAPLPSALPRLARAEELSRRWAALAAARQARREQHRAELVREVGARLSDPEVGAELKQHAKRLAELARLEFLAQNARQGKDRDQLLARISKLTARETERHRRRIARLTAAPRSSAAGSAAPAPSREAPR
jgi:hypothetical protein